jgi:hypothetical protein
VREYQGVKMSWVTLDRIVSEEIVRDDDIRRRAHRGRLADICRPFISTIGCHASEPDEP